jgi:hypothetical protein
MFNNIVFLGAADAYLTGTPQITHFRNNFRHDYNYALSSSLGPSGTVNPSRFTEPNESIGMIEAIGIVGTNEIKPNLYARNIYLEFIPFNEKIKETKCAICLLDFDNTSKIHITKCCHVYHQNCLHEYIKTVNETTYRCPLCRTSIDTEYKNKEIQEND